MKEITQKKHSKRVGSQEVTLTKWHHVTVSNSSFLHNRCCQGNEENEDIQSEVKTHMFADSDVMSRNSSSLKEEGLAQASLFEIEKCAARWAH